MDTSSILPDLLLIVGIAAFVALLWALDTYWIKVKCWYTGQTKEEYWAGKDRITQAIASDQAAYQARTALYQQTFPHYRHLTKKYGGAHRRAWEDQMQRLAEGEYLNRVQLDSIAFTAGAAVTDAYYRQQAQNENDPYAQRPTPPWL